MDVFDIFNQEEDKPERQETSRYSQPASYSSGNVFVISVGGSVFAEKKPDAALLGKFANTINSMHREGYRFVLVTGGGKVARDYAAAAKSLGAGNFMQDELGIAVTRVNAKLLIAALEDVHEEVLTNINDAKKIIDSGKIPVYGGLIPGFTTDAVSALLAESLNATFINLTNVDGVYSSDPKHSRNAKFFPELSYEKLISLMKLHGSKPGQNLVLDLPCCLILKRSNLRALVMNGTDLSNFESAVRGGEWEGTTIYEPAEGEEDLEQA